MAEEFAVHDYEFVFIYTREAHPSDRYPAHETMAQKVGQARAMVERWGIKRLMLVDDLDGTIHHAYGRLPNMTYVVKPGGTIVYRASWTDPRTIRKALEQIHFERVERRAKRRITPYYMEWQPHRRNDAIEFVEGLLEVGERAVEEYIAAVEETEGGAAAKPLKEWWAEKKAGG